MDQAYHLSAASLNASYACLLQEPVETHNFSSCTSMASDVGNIPHELQSVFLASAEGIDPT